MEIRTLYLAEIEPKLLNIRSLLIILDFAVNGLRNMDLIDNKEISGFEHITEEILMTINELINLLDRK